MCHIAYLRLREVISLNIITEPRDLIIIQATLLVLQVKTKGPERVEDLPKSHSHLEKNWNQISISVFPLLTSRPLFECTLTEKFVSINTQRILAPSGREGSSKASRVHEHLNRSLKRSQRSYSSTPLTLQLAFHAQLNPSISTH